MHESRLVTDLLDEALRIADLNEAKDIQQITFSIGALSHVTAISLESHLRESAVGSAAQDASFSITKSTDTSAADALDVRLVSMTIGDG